MKGYGGRSRKEVEEHKGGEEVFKEGLTNAQYLRFQCFLIGLELLCHCSDVHLLALKSFPTEPSSSIPGKRQCTGTRINSI